MSTTDYIVDSIPEGYVRGGESILVQSGASLEGVYIGINRITSILERNGYRQPRFLRTADGFDVLIQGN